jgi:hypothetical protein
MQNKELPQWLLGRSTWNDELVFLDHRTDGKRSSLANNPRRQQLAGVLAFLSPVQRTGDTLRLSPRIWGASSTKCRDAV